MKTINHQIKYMETEVDWYEGKVFSGKDWNDELETCRAILETLEEVRDSQQAKVTP